MGLNLQKERPSVEFDRVNRAAMAALPALVKRWLPDGKRKGAEWISVNPTRDDKRAGSFKINLITGRWADFATGDRGGDPISLAAYLFRLRQGEAARNISDILGLR